MLRALAAGLEVDRDQLEVELADLHVDDQRLATARIVEVGAVEQERILGRDALLEEHADVEVPVLLEEHAVVADAHVDAL